MAPESKRPENTEGSKRALPLRHGNEIHRIGGGHEADVFGFEPEPEKKYVFKEIWEDSFAFDTYKGKTLEEMAAVMQKVYKILKRHGGEYIAPTRHLLARNKEGRPGIMRIQEKIGGKLLEEFLNENYLVESGSPRETCDRQREDLRERARAAGQDPEFLELIEDGKVTLPKGTTAEEFFGEVFHVENIIVDDDGNIRVIDW